MREPNKPHLVELEYPTGVEQQLAISLIEPDAAGRVTRNEQDASLVCDGRSIADDGAVSTHRFVIWPRTRTPQLLIANTHDKKPAQFGKMRLLKQDEALAAISVQPATDPSEKLVAAYLDKPRLAEIFGASETLDPVSGISVQSWSTFLDGTRRLAQSLRFSGYNGVVLSVAADGSALYPSQRINPSPRHDTGILAASGHDPLRKDVLEMMLRIFDREGLRVVPTLQLSAPLPRLEASRRKTDPQQSGILCVDHMGSTIGLASGSETLGAGLYNPLNPQVQDEIVAVADEVLARYAHHASFASLGVQLGADGYGMLPSEYVGFDDATVARFVQETAIAIPNGEPNRFATRAGLLLGEHRSTWNRWRQERLTRLYARLGQRVATVRGEARLLVLTEGMFDSPQLRQQQRSALAQSIPLREVLATAAVDLEAIAKQPAVTVVTSSRLKGCSATPHTELLGANSEAGHLSYHGDRSFRLPSFDERSPFGVDQTYLTISSTARPDGLPVYRSLIAAMASREVAPIVVGGDSLVASANREAHDVLATLRALPAADPATRLQTSQPVVMRVYRSADKTIVSLTNESPWPADAELLLSSAQPSQWRKLGAGTASSSADTLGTLSASDQNWPAALQPYGIIAWEFSDPRLRVGELQVSVDERAKEELRRRIAAIESRATNLGIQRTYPQLQNPGFEVQYGENLIAGWQPRQGRVGSVSTDDAAAHSGARALRLQSGDNVGVAAQTHLFDAPATGQLTVSCFVRAVNVGSDAQLNITVQGQADGLDYQRVATLGTHQLGDTTWVRQQFTLSDVPTEPGQQLRLLFHATGNAEIMIDDVELCDLRFDEARRRTLVKRIHGANLALQQGQLVDCLRVVDDHWSRFIVEHVPPATAVTSVASKPVTPTPAADEATESPDDKGVGSRLRGWVPKIWR